MASAADKWYCNTCGALGPMNDGCCDSCGSFDIELKADTRAVIPANGGVGDEQDWVDEMWEQSAPRIPLEHPLHKRPLLASRGGA